MAAVVGLWLGADAASSSDLGEAAARAEKLGAEQRTLEAFEALDEARSILWAGQPMTILRAALVEEVSGYGLYTPLAETRFAPGDSVVLYAEPVAFGYRRLIDGGYEIALDADIAIELDSGQVIAEGRGISSFVSRAARPVKAFHVALSFGLPEDLKPGRYRIVLTLRDRHGSGSAEAALPVELVDRQHEASTQ